MPAEDHHAAVYHVDDAVDGDLAVAKRCEWPKRACMDSPAILLTFAVGVS